MSARESRRNAVVEEEQTDKELRRLFFILFGVIFAAAHLLLFIEPPELWEILAIEACIALVGLMLFVAWRIIHLDSRPKNKLLRTVEEMEEFQHIEYEQFEHTIKCRVYTPGMVIWCFIWFYAVVLILYAHFTEFFPRTPESVIIVSVLVSILTVNFVLIPLGMKMHKQDHIDVDPKNQTFIIRKSTWIYFHRRKPIVVPWNETKVIAGEFRAEQKTNSRELRRVEFKFADKHHSYFEVVDNEDYLEIIPKAFKNLTTGDYLGQLMALKALSLYHRKYSVRSGLIWAACIMLLAAELFFLLW